MSQYANDFTNTVQIYYDELKKCKYKPISKAKERRLLKQCKRGNLKAKNELLEANLRFVFDIAKHYTGRGVPISDLISEGNMGLLKAVDKFDDTNDVKFISYAVWWIRQAITESIKRKKSVTFVEIAPNESNYSSIENMTLSDEEDESSDYNDGTYTNEHDERVKEVKTIQKEVVSKLLNVLDERERNIMESYYGLGMNEELTLFEIGKKYHLSSERVRQIKKQGLKKMRSKMLLQDDFEDLFV